MPGPPKKSPLRALVILACCVGAFLLSWFVALPEEPMPGGDAAKYFPDDGAYTFTDDGTQISWSLVDGEAAMYGPPVVVTPFLDAADPLSEISKETWLREQHTRPNGDQAYTFYSLDDNGVHRRAQGDHIQPTVFMPSLLELPGDVAAGATWSSKGEATTPSNPEPLPFTAKGRAEESFGSCLRITMRIVIGDDDWGDEVRTWCPGGSAPIPEQPGDVDPVPFEPGEDVTWEPESWELSQHVLTRFNTTVSIVGIGMAGVDAGTYLQLQTEEVIGVDTTGGEGWENQWWFDPPGLIVDMIQVGSDTIIATRKGLYVLGPNHQIQRRIEIDEIITKLIPLGANRYLTIDTSGAITARIAGGDDVVWSHRNPQAWRGEVSVCPSGIALRDADGNAELLDLATGEVRAEIELDRDSAPLTCAADRIVAVLFRGETVAMDSDGDEIWSVETTDSAAQLVSTGGAVAYIGSDGFYVFDSATGEQLLHSDDEVLTTATDGSTLAALTPRELFTVDASGHETSRHPLPGDTTITGAKCLPFKTGLQCVVGGDLVVMVQ